MTRPTDAAIARAFYSAVATIKPEHIEGVQAFVSAVIAKAAEIDAESPAVMFKSAPEVTTSPERVQIPAEITHVPLTGRQIIASLDRQSDEAQAAYFKTPISVRYPKCTASLPAGKTCGGLQCGLKEPK